MELQENRYDFEIAQGGPCHSETGRRQEKVQRQIS